jgi:hypothetical protein
MRWRLIVRSMFTVLTLAFFWNVRAATNEMTVYKTSTCSCCSLWVTHLKDHGFQVRVQDVPNPAEYRRKHGVPENLSSCHTAIIEGYTIEGHVPAAEVQRLLKQRPKAVGLAVPGMPLGSPGMEAARSERYAVLLVYADGTTSVYKEYPAR